MNAELKKQLLIGLFAIIVALIGAAGAIIPTMRNQESSALKEENSQLEETISELTEENSQLKERISVLENELEVATDTNTNSTDISRTMCMNQLICVLAMTRSSSRLPGCGMSRKILSTI